MVDYRIARSEVEGETQDGLFWAVAEPLWPGSDDDEEDLAIAQSGTPGMRAVMATTLLGRVVDNGGLARALANQDPGMVQMALDGYRTLGAAGHAAALESALRLLLGDDPPGDPAERRSRIEAHDRAWLQSNIEPLNEAMYDERRLWPFYQSYIDAHPEEFFRD